MHWRFLVAAAAALMFATPVAAQTYQKPLCCVVKQVIKVNDTTNTVYGRSRLDSIKVRMDRPPQGWARFVLDSLVGPTLYRWHDTTVYTVRDSVVPVYDTTWVTDTIPVIVPFYDTIPVFDTTFVTVYDTVPVVDTVPPTGGGTATGKPYGPIDLLNAPTTAPFTYSGGESSNRYDWLLENIADARKKNVAFVANLPCGSHSSLTGGRCMAYKPNTATSVPGDSVWMYDRARFLAALKGYDRPDVRAAVASAVRDGVLLGINLIDEPWVSGGDDGAGTVVPNSWGPPGTLSKAEVDFLCSEARKYFPGVPLGTSDHRSSWEPSKPRKICDIGIFQYSFRFGDVAQWREQTLALAARDGYMAMYSHNVINGGTQDKADGTYDCKDQGGVKGSRSPNCSMTKAQILAVVEALGDQGCGGLTMWEWDATRFARQAWKDAFAQAAELQAQRAPRPCKVR